MTNAFTADPIADLWSTARLWLEEAMAAFGGPAAIARAVTHAARDAIRRRLALIDSLLSKLILIEAAHLSGAAPRARAACAFASAVSAARCAPAEDPNRPETWRVRYRLRVPPPPRRRVHADGDGAVRFTPRSPAERAAAAARALARRFEAIRRVCADPSRAAAALARRLEAWGEAAHAIARRIALARPPRLASAPEPHAHATVIAHDACAVWRNTS